MVRVKKIDLRKHEPSLNSDINLRKTPNIDLKKKPDFEFERKRRLPDPIFWLPNIQEPSGGLVPIGDSGLYITPDTPADPQDCERYPDSPWCGGNPYSWKPFNIEISLALDACNIGIRFDGIFGFVKVPPISLVYRRPECREALINDPSPTPGDLPTYCGYYYIPSLGAQDYQIDVKKILSYQKIPGIYVGRGEFICEDWIVFYEDCSGKIHQAWNATVDQVQSYEPRYQNKYINEELLKQGIVIPDENSERYKSPETGGQVLSIGINGAPFRVIEGAGCPCFYFPPSPPKEKCCMGQCCPPPDNSLLKALVKKVNELDRKLGQFPQLANIQNDAGETVARPIESVSLGIKAALEKVNEIHERIGEFPQSLELEGEEEPIEVKSIAESVKLTSERIELINKTIGIDEFPASVPESFISKDEGFIGNLLPNPNKEIKNLSQLFVWYVERWDEVMGQFEIAIKLKDADPTKPGDQPLGLKLPNLAETLAEMVLLLLQTSINSETLLNITTRSLAESGQIKQQAFKIYNQAEALLDYFNFENKQVIQKMPLSFKPGEEKFEDMLQDTELDVAVTEFSDKNDFTDDMYDLKQAAAIIRAQNFRRVPMGDAATMTAFLKDMIRGFGATSDAVSKQEKDENGKDDFDRRLEDIELGFTNKTGITDATHPYGRNFEERPRIKRLEDTSSQGGTS